MTTTDVNIGDNIHRIKRKISSTANLYPKAADDIQLLAVSKTFSAQAIRAAYTAGQRLFGESYIDEAIEKIQLLSESDIEWHYIGPIQSNKTRKIASHFAWTQSLGTARHARRLNEHRLGQSPLNVCIQVNISGENTKSGIALHELEGLAELVSGLPNLKLRGIMGIPAPEKDFEKQRKAFAKLAQAYDRLQNQGYLLDTLSMGMTSDMQAAIAEGTTMVRIGTAIFGQRQKKTVRYD